MSMASHLSQLRERHAVLDREIEETAKSPGSNDLELTAMKRRKLQLKEQISRLSSEQAL